MTSVVLVTLLLMISPQAAIDTGPVDCTFSNPRYAGQCVEQVTPAANQTPVQACKAILACLNNPSCVKDYCRSTTIRGGWSLVSPKDE